MTPQTTITFHCPSCSMKLQVPSQMAGVAGPCPQCSATITAPMPQQAAPQPVPVQPQQPAQQPQSQPQAQQVAPAPSPLPAAQPVAPAQPAQVSQSAPPRQTTAAPRPESPQLRPVEPIGSTQSRGGGRSEPRKRSRWMGIVFPVLLLCAAVALVLAVLEATNMIDLFGLQDKGQTASKSSATTNPKGQTPSADSKNPATENPEQNGNGSSSTDTSNPDAKSGEPPVPVVKPTHVDGQAPELELPTNTGAQTSPEPSAPESPAPPVSSNNPEGAVVASPDPPTVGEANPPPVVTSTTNQPDQSTNPQHRAGFLANRTLEKFLHAKTLAERLPLMAKSSRTQEQLEKSCLSKPFKKIVSYRFLQSVPDQSNGNRQFLYYVIFEDKDEPRQRHTILAQVCERPGRHEPQVHCDAFIDYYDKRLRAYAKRKDTKLKSFHCVVEVRTATVSKEVPPEMRNQLIRFEVKTSPQGKAVFNAFLNKSSPLMRKIGAGKAFPYTTPRFCTMSFRWNVDNPDYPHIEFVDFVSLSWEK